MVEITHGKPLGAWGAKGCGDAPGNCAARLHFEARPGLAASAVGLKLCACERGRGR